MIKKIYFFLLISICYPCAQINSTPSPWKLLAYASAGSVIMPALYAANFAREYYTTEALGEAAVAISYLGDDKSAIESSKYLTRSQKKELINLLHDRPAFYKKKKEISDNLHKIRLSYWRMGMNPLDRDCKIKPLLKYEFKASIFVGALLGLLVGSHI